MRRTRSLQRCWKDHLVFLTAMFAVLDPEGTVRAEGSIAPSVVNATGELIFADGFEDGNYFSWSRAEVGSSDTTSPGLVIVSPQRVLYNNPSPPIEFTFEDSGDGIAEGSFRLSLDGLDLTADCTIVAGTATCPNPTLSPGAHPLTVSVWDLAGNRTEENRDVVLVIDTTAPDLSITEPVYEILFRPSVAIGARFVDFESGIVRDSVRIVLDGEDISTTCATGWTSASCDPRTLTPGSHEIRVEVEDAAGNLANEVHTFQLADDGVSPSLTISAPENRTHVNQPPRYLRFQHFDAESGVDRDATLILLNGIDVTQSCSRGGTSGLCHLDGLGDGSHVAEVRVADYQGNQASVVVPFVIASNLGPPEVTILEPAQGSVVTGNPVTLRARILDDNAVAWVEHRGATLDLVGDEVVVEFDLEDGHEQHQIWAEDEFGKRSNATVLFRVDLNPPTLRIREPADGLVVNQAQVRVRGTTSDAAMPLQVAVNGAPVPLDGVWFDTVVALVPGENLLHVRSVDSVGHAIEETRTVTLIQPPKVGIVTPLADELVFGNVATVAGTVSDSAAVVTVNGVEASVSGGDFEATDVPIQPGANLLSAKAVLPSGWVSSTSVTVLRDVLAPRLTVYTPESGSTTSSATIPVAGLVNDLVPGTVSGEDVSVTVNGVPAEVANRGFLARDVPLNPGSNSLEVVASDVSGNTARRQLFVERDDSPGERIATVSGNGQTGTVREPLAEALRVQVVGPGGQPAEGRHVIFEVQGNDGTFPNGLRRVSRVTDAVGEAAAAFVLGGRAGAGLVIVEATSPGIDLPARFVATATAGPPAFLIPDSGAQQVGITEQPLPAPLVATVTDTDHNRLIGVEVSFQVVEGGGSFANGSADRTATTDGSGRAMAQLTLGTADGRANNIVEASLPDFPAIPAVGFFASGRAAGAPADTKIVGVVHDNTDRPVPGVTVGIEGTSLTTQANADGYFEIFNAPSGLQFLHVEGETASRPGLWPNLEFELLSVPGRVNSLPGPIYLLPIDEARGLAVSDVEGGTLTLPEIPGLALEIEAGSVTFPDGGQDGVVSITAVHSDKVPMPPNFGQQPRLVVTIQPAGATFDPPARFSLPNTDGLPPGSVTELYSFDHDLGRFVSIGPGTVSEDSSTVVSNPGVGIVKAGWHCGGNPAPAGTPHDCPECKICSGIRCVPIPFCPRRDAASFPESTLLGLLSGVDCDCSDGDDCTSEECNGQGECAEEEGGPGKMVESVNITVAGMDPYEAEYDGNGDVDFLVRVTAKNCIPEVRVNNGAGITKTATQTAPGNYQVTHGYISEGLYQATAEAYCPECLGKTSDSDTMTVDLYKVAIKLEAGETVISEDGKYTEDTVITATAVRQRDGATIESFVGTVEIEETTSPPLYSQNGDLGADLPSSISISAAGSGTVLAKSLAEADSGSAPLPAKIRVVNHPAYGADPLSIQQWIFDKNLDPIRSKPGKYNYAWFEARVKDLYEQASGDLQVVSAPAVLYEQSDDFDGRSLRAGEMVPLTGGTGIVRVNPLIQTYRANRDSGESICGAEAGKGLDNTIYHEWRHAYQWNLVHQDIGIRDGGPYASNSDDGDGLVDVVPIGPSTFSVDTPAERDTCNIDVEPPARETRSYKGDTIFDEYQSPDWVTYAYEMDAYVFAAEQGSQGKM